MAKSYRGSSGSGVTEAEQGSNHVRYHQRHIEGTPGAAVFLGTPTGSELLGVTRQLVGKPWTGAAKFQYCGSVGPWNLATEAKQQLVLLGEVLVDSFRLQGLFGVDFVLNGEQVWTVEVNPRYSASVEILEGATGVAAIQRRSRRHRQRCPRGATPCESARGDDSYPHAESVG